MTIGIIVAMDKERALIAEQLQGKQVHSENHQELTEGTLGAHKIVLLQSGIGKVASAVGAVELIRQYQPDCIINTGVAGALDSSVHVLDVVAAERVVYHDVDCFTDNPHGCIQGFPLYYETSEMLFKAIKSLSTDIKLHYGLICSGDQFVSNLDSLKAIKGYFPDGLAVDMESCSIAQVCYMYNVPFLSVRIISDTPGITNHEEQYYDFWKVAPERSFKVLKKLLETI